MYNYYPLYNIFYRTKDNIGWSPWQIGELNNPVFLTLRSLIQGIEFYAVDALGNVEDVHYEEFGGFPPIR